MTDQETSDRRAWSAFSASSPTCARARATALLLSLNVFLILMAYYVLKPVREALILGEGSAELKTYMSAGQVVVLAFVVPVLRPAGGAVPADAADQRRHRVLRRLPVRSSTSSRSSRCRWRSCSSSGSASSI